MSLICDAEEKLCRNFHRFPHWLLPNLHRGLNGYTPVRAKIVSDITQFRDLNIETLDSHEKQVKSTSTLPVTIDESLNVSFHQLQVGGEIMSANIDYYHNPYESEGLYYRYDFDVK